MCHYTNQAITHQLWKPTKSKTQNRMALTKSSTIQKIHRCGQRPKKEQIFAAVQPVFLYPFVEQLTGFEQVSVLTMLYSLFASYGAIDEINLKGKRGKNDGAL